LKNVIDERLKDIIIYCAERNSLENKKIDSFDVRLVILINSIFQEGFIYKNSKFKEENEWRLYRTVAQSNYNDSDGIDAYGYFDALDGIFTNKKMFDGDLTLSELKFNSTLSDMKCYFEVGFEKIKSQIIKKIILGPKCKVEPFDLALLLAEKHYVKNFVDDSIKIIKSKIPYI
jgi:hypothetical protein